MSERGRSARAVSIALAAVLALAGCTASATERAPSRAAAKTPAFSPFAQRQVDDRQAMYPRLVRLRDGRIILGVASATGDGVTDMARFYESSDGGRTFRMLSEILDPAAAGGRGSCCGSLFELPRRLGAQPAGTLLWAGTAGMKNHAPGRRPELRVWRSADGGRHWSYLSSCATGAEGTPWDQGLWEPELAVDGQGRLVCYYSDETRPGHDQVIAEVASTDGGATWGPATVVVAAGRHDRPGMPVVRRLADGTYFMVYEVCGPSASCKIHYRKSADGWTWGDPASRGTAARTADGRSLYHAPTVTWVPGGGPQGTILIGGGAVRDAEGGLVRESSGTTLFANSGTGWHEVPAPVHVPFPADPDDSDIVCFNYSSSLLPMGDGKGLLEAATQRGEDGVCRAYVAAASRSSAAAETMTNS
ncbi:exo-alpha-sialidase [Actinomadura darangshiensis]|uniref:Exo-alpha-sialidase n=1 Tax=Actinomadura darangshiensis TaxID=705336 RepID=A0A4R5A118_9ACTN|nr:sialidase family protein [Actinomadura darangshiensis]TDD64159.1 exo-alpha-sialidase [Actinomadura darangshiensis]